MGVYARQHAQQLLLDTSPLGGFGGPSKTDVKVSPRAHLLLLHIAQNFAGSESKIRDLKKMTLWDTQNKYFEGLGKKAQAIGYNVPDDLDLRAMGQDPDQTKDLVNAANRAKVAVQKATKELLVSGFLAQTPEMQGRRGQTAHFMLPFLSAPCTICELDPADPSAGMDPTLHIPAKVRERLEESADDWSNNMPSANKHRTKKPANSRYKELMTKDAPWGKPKQTPMDKVRDIAEMGWSLQDQEDQKEPGWGEPWGNR